MSSSVTVLVSFLQVCTLHARTLHVCTVLLKLERVSSLRSYEKLVYQIFVSCLHIVACFERLENIIHI